MNSEGIVSRSFREIWTLSKPTTRGWRVTETNVPEPVHLLHKAPTARWPHDLRHSVQAFCHTLGVTGSEHPPLFLLC